MKRSILWGLLLCIIIVIFLIAYSILILIKEKNRIKYYNSTLLYDTNYDKYFTLVKKQKREILKRRIQLTYLSLLTSAKELFLWKKH